MNLPLSPPWTLATDVPPADFQRSLQRLTGLPSQYLAQLLWNRGLRDRDQLPGWLDPKQYQPCSALDFGPEMTEAIDRLVRARSQQEKIAIWGDFDADGVTATAVLWDGLGQFFAKHDRLTYYIPNRLTESHGLSPQGLDRLHREGVQLIVTCDTGSTNLTEINYCKALGIDVIVTDHHTLPPERPPVCAIVNPRYLAPEHPLASLSGVAVAYKLVEALYDRLSQVPEKPLEHLLDLVVIGLIADLVDLKGDCRYLAQQGIAQLKQQADRTTATRPGLFHLLEFCKRAGDRATDISFGIGPRINAVSRIQGDAHFCVELLTSSDAAQCRQLAEQTELANTRRRALQREVAEQVLARVRQLDLSTTQVIVLWDEQWPPGVLGLVASQVAQEFGRPTILLSTESTAERTAGDLPIARGSARSANQIDLYELVQDQAHLLHRFGGHPYAAGLSLVVENLPLFAEAINQRALQSLADRVGPRPLQADLQVTVAELGLDLYRELRCIEPCGMGNPPPQLLLKDVWFTQATHRNLTDRQNKKVTYIRTTFRLCDETCPEGISGSWWGHYKEELPTGRCEVLVELENNVYQRCYEVRLIEVRSRATIAESTAWPNVLPNPSSLAALESDRAPCDWLLDWRSLAQSNQPVPPNQNADINADILVMTTCPTDWDAFKPWFRRAYQEQKKLAIAYSTSPLSSSTEPWLKLLGIAKYLSRTQAWVTPQRLLDHLQITPSTLRIGLQALQTLGLDIISGDRGLTLAWPSEQPPGGTIARDRDWQIAGQPFLQALQEESFRRQYFATVPLSLLQTLAHRTISLELRSGV
ncbi:single-stranded-DNA-specific exonuclease RecJ [Alkalinema sp. FACHB-956]|uniref:single-stranded-DNA-specific exonuclease RecJ n=1 Tax=Alkalinema sp. FACHB-956 TaxID=2692768 RepID=UPI001684FB92|nr:single-stranded-DNA-specific exonuclease RecJ [Alkalinema sp. FACHB-956]MBD2329453.1 single-stranded-DNA-specific exonuclease RecJ [Alkalinema sp. FACHB-956]